MGIWCAPIALTSSNVNAIDNGTAAGFANAFRNEPGLVYRSTGLSGTRVIIDFGSAQSIGCIAIIGSNFTSSATWQVRATNVYADLITSPSYDSGAVQAWASTKKTARRAKSLMALPSPQTYRYWHFELLDGTNPDGFIEFQRLIMGKAVSPAINADYGAEFTITDPSPKERAATGYETAEELDLLPGWRVTYSWITKAEMEADVRPLMMTIGESRPVLFVPNPGIQSDYLQDEIVFGRIASQATLSLTDFDIHTFEASIISLAS